MAEITHKSPRARPRRRTQEERRTATRAALLEATIECLVSYGYANTTLDRVVERAGVSRGAQTYHFPTKTELVAEALSDLIRRQSEELLLRLEKLPEGPERIDSALDILWEIHSGPLFEATLELFVAARTDAELRTRLREVEREVNRVVATGVARYFSEYSPRPDFANLIDVGLSAIRGLALLAAARGEDRSDVERRWQVARSVMRSFLEAEGGP
jgi:AcrR family transcriptional regulator